MKSARSPTQTCISDYFHVEISEAINNEEMTRTEVNKVCGNEKTQSVAPIMELLFENAKKNSACLSKHANRHDTTVQLSKNLHPFNEWWQIAKRSKKGSFSLMSYQIT